MSGFRRGGYQRASTARRKEQSSPRHIRERTVSGLREFCVEYDKRPSHDIEMTTIWRGGEKNGLYSWNIVVEINEVSGNPKSPYHGRCARHNRAAHTGSSIRPQPARMSVRAITSGGVDLARVTHSARNDWDVENYRRQFPTQTDVSANQ